MSAASKGKVGPNKGKKFSDETRMKMSIADKGKPKSEAFKQNLVDFYAKPENKEKKSQEMTEYYKTHEHVGKKVLYEYAELRRQGIVPGGNTGKHCSDETKQKHSERSKKNWEKPEYAKKVLSSNGIRPNKQEDKILNILNELFPTEWKYVGDGDTIIGRKNPDFININGKKQLIELFGDYWHKGQNPQDRIDHFSKYGYDTLVIWEKELKNETLIKEKICSFSLGGIKNDL